MCFFLSFVKFVGKVAAVRWPFVLTTVFDISMLLPTAWICRKKLVLKRMGTSPSYCLPIIRTICLNLLKLCKNTCLFYCVHSITYPTMITETPTPTHKYSIVLTFVGDSWCAKFEPGHGDCGEKVGELTESEYCTAKYQAERSADVTHQSQRRVRSFILGVCVLQLREKYLRSQTSL